MRYDFKEGDWLTCIEKDNAWLDYGKDYQVVGIWQSSIEEGPAPVIDLNGRNDHFFASRFKPSDKKDEELPEIGSSLYRYEVWGGHVELLHVIDSKEYDKVLLILERHSQGECVRASLFKLDPDDALALAADLTRMAMQARRRSEN